MLTKYQKDFLETILSIPSVGGNAEDGAPYGRKPREVLDTFLSEAAKNGFKTGMVGDRAGWVEFGKGEKLIGIICHLDVVPVSEGWDSDPFTLTFRTDEELGEMMYARGIVDDKGPACASFFAMKELLGNGMVPENHRVRLILGTDEERTCSCIQYYAAHGEIPDFAITPDSVFPVIHSEKGILQIKLHGKNKNNLVAHGGSAINIVPNHAYSITDGKRINVVGKAAHASKPELGINAITLLAETMEREGVNLSDFPVMKFIKDFNPDDITGVHGGNDYGELTYNPGILNIDKDVCELRIDFRIPASMDCDRMISKIKEKAATYDLTSEVTLNLAPLSVDKNSEEVRKLTAIWERHIDKFTGFNEEYRQLHLKPKAVGVGTYARHIPNTIAFGIQAPWHTDQCHQANEHVAVSDFLQWIAIIKEFITEFTEE